MEKLRFLYLQNVILSGSFEEIFENLRWFGWEYCPLECLPSDFGPEKLVILALSGSKMKTMWKLNMVGDLNIFLHTVYGNMHFKMFYLICLNCPHFNRYQGFLKI